MKNVKKLLYFAILGCVITSNFNIVDAKQEHKQYSNVEGIYTLKCSDYPGASSLTLEVNGKSGTIACDYTPPTGIVTYSPTGWTNKDVIVSVTCNDEGSGCERNVYTKTITTNENGKITIADNVGNTTDINYSVKNIDKKIPSLTGINCTGLDSNNNSSSQVTCSASLSNLGPSQDTLTYSHISKDGDTPGTNPTKNSDSIPKISYTYTDNGTYDVSAYGEDQAGNKTTQKDITFKIDTSKPSITSDFDPNKWYREVTLPNIIFKLKDQVSSTTDNEETGLKELTVKVNNSLVNVAGFNVTNGTSSVNVTLSKNTLLSKITEKADNKIYVKVVDKVGFYQEVEYTLKYDNTAPEVLTFNDTNSNWRNTNVTANITTSDSLSGLNTKRFLVGTDLDNDCSNGSETVPVLANEDGIYTVYACSKDNAGNVTKKNQIYKIDKSKPSVGIDKNGPIVHSGSINLKLFTSDFNESNVLKSSQVKFSNYKVDGNCASGGTAYSNNALLSISTEGLHNVSLCNSDNAGSIDSQVYGAYIIDLTNPKVSLASIANSKKAAENNVTMNTTIFDDEGKTDTTTLYGKNYDVGYELSVSGPKQAGYAGTVKSPNSVNITISGNVQNNTSLNKSFSLTLAGVYEIEVKLKDKSGRTYSETKTITIYPADIDESKSVVTVNSNSDRYANNNDYYLYTSYLKDKYENVIHGKTILSLNQDCTLYTGCSVLKTNMVTNSGDTGMISYDFGTPSDNNGKVTFKVKSLVPGKFTQRFSLTLKTWNDNYIDTATTDNFHVLSLSTNGFKKPFIGFLKGSKDGGVSWNDYPEIGTDMKYKLTVALTGTTLTIGNLNINNYKNYVKAIDSKTLLQSISDISGLNGYSSQFNALMNTAESATSLGVPGIQVTNNDNKSPVEISYDIGGKNVKYYLSANENIDDRTVIKLSDTDNNFIGIKVIGQLQGAGKSQFTGQDQNFTDLSTSDTRTQIRKNAYVYVDKMTNGQILNNVKYVIGDISISGDVGNDYETLVVKNGNIKITGDLNTNGKKLGIIVLKDGYNVADGYSGQGNIYIYPNVTKINAILYADGGIISVKNSGTPYSYSELASRTVDLQKQLWINGSIFTRNTIGGGILAGGTYVLPGGSKLTNTSSNFMTAVQYDLNYIRRGSQGWDINGNGTLDNNEYKAGVVVKYDSTLQSNPPKIFGN